MCLTLVLVVRWSMCSEGKAFLDKNAAVEGVKVLPSGLQYKGQHTTRRDTENRREMERASERAGGRMMSA